MDKLDILEKYLKEEVKLNDYRTQQELEGLQKYPDLVNEFVDYIVNGWKEDLIIVEGFNAKTLHENYPLSVLGAYNYLISLRDDKELALEYLKKGLPRG